MIAVCDQIMRNFKSVAFKEGERERNIQRVIGRLIDRERETDRREGDEDIES